MAETLTPNLGTAQMQRSAVSCRIQSPTAPLFIGSNDDNLERAQARAARASATRRKAAPPPLQQPQKGLGKEQILELFHNCIKLASENKINQKNTWELGLIDHLYEIVKVDENEVETNFQKASCTLEAGVKIYSMRVDSVHSEAYKVLGGINRVGSEKEPVTMSEGDDADNSIDEGFRKEADKKMHPFSTLESSFEALNVKKFDAAFSVDPLYHQTSAQFDEGGAKGLLLNNLGIYGRCRVLFDSLEVPGKPLSNESQLDKDERVDLSFIGECVKNMVFNMRMKNEISPTLTKMINQFDEDNKRPDETAFFRSSKNNDSSNTDDVDWDNNGLGSSGNWNDDCDDVRSAINDDYDRDPVQTSHQQEHETFYNSNTDYLSDENIDEKIETCLLAGLGITSKHNSWAGPGHWKFLKAKVPVSTSKSGSPIAAKKTKNRKQTEVEIDFSKPCKDIKEIFAPPKNPKSLLLPTSKVPSNVTLPEDCHYQPENLVKLFLLPNITCLGPKREKPLVEMKNDYYDNGSLPSWGPDEIDGDNDDGDACSNVDEPDMLVPQPRLVNKMEVKYDKTSKQVDVQALKETLWSCLQKSSDVSSSDVMVSFKQVLGSFPNKCKAAVVDEDISPHLCFICLLHLANEHGLVVCGCDSLDDLSITRCSSQATTSTLSC